MLLVWLIVQIGALGLAAGRVPLAANWVVPGERGATIELLVIQIATSALLFPSLLKDLNRTVIVAASAWPMLRLAGLLGGEEVAGIYAAGVYLTVWIGVLAIWRIALQTERARMIGVAAAAAWSIGGPFLMYLHAEFGGAKDGWPGDGWVWAALGGPIWGAVSRLSGFWGFRKADWLLGILLLSGFFCAVFSKFCRKA